LGIFELLLVNDAVRKQIQATATASDINAAARASGMASLREDGIEKIRAGVTTVDEVLRVTMRASV
jgi:general secretion pathway protein E